MRRIALSILAAVLLGGLTAAPAGAAPSTADDAVREPSAHSVVYRQEAVIAADPGAIWRLLVDLNGYAAWNPWVVRAEGDAVPGAEVDVDVMLGSYRMAATHVVLAVDPQTRFCWRDAGWNAWFVYGQRCRWLEPRADGTVLLRQELLLDGVLSPVADHTIGKAMRNGMAAETAALKARAEQPLP